MSSPKVEVLVKDCHATIGEGPHWDVASQSLYTVDIVSGGVHRWDARTGKEDKIKLDGTVGFVIPREKGGLVVGLRRTISALDYDTKTTETLVEVEHGTNNFFNDAKCDAAGRLWAGTMGAESSPGVVEPGKGTLYCLNTQLELSKHQDKVDISNGMGWNDDNTVMYYIDSMPKKVYAYDFDFAGGNISNRRVAVDIVSAGAYFPDGMCVDCNGNIWVACFGASKVVQFDPNTGKAITTVDFPVTDVTSCCFGGPHLDELYVTCNQWKLPEGSEQPLAGSIFRVTGLGVKGRASNNFRG